MPTAAARDLAAAEGQRHKEAVSHARRMGTEPPKGQVKWVSQRKSYGDEIVVAHIPESLIAGEIVHVPVQGGHSVEAEVPADDSDLWLAHRCVEFIIPNEEENKEPVDREEQEEKEVLSHGEEYHQRLDRQEGQGGTAPDEDLAGKNFAQVKERPQDKFEFPLTREHLLKMENDAYENRKGADGRVATTEVDKMGGAMFAKPMAMRPKKLTQTEERATLFAWGRKGTHTTLEKAKKAHSERPRNENGNVAPTGFDATPQRARFGQPVKPKKKVLTDREEMNKDWAHGRTTQKNILKSHHEAYDKKKGPDGRVPTTEIDQEVDGARFARVPDQRPRKRTHAEENERRFGPAGRKDTHRSLGKANKKYNSRPRNDDGNVKATAFDETPMKARFAQPRKADTKKGKERRKEARRGRDSYARNDMRRMQLLAKLEYEDRRNAEPKLRDIDTVARTPAAPRYKPALSFDKTLSDVDEGSEGGKSEGGEGGDTGNAAAGKGAKEGEIGPNAAGGGGPTISLDDDDSNLDYPAAAAAAPKMSIQPLEAKQGDPLGLKI